MRILPLARHTIALAGAVGLALTSAGAAQASSSRGWRVVKTFGPSDSTWTENFVATGPHDAWSTWQACKACASSHPVNLFSVERSTGGAWHQVPIPSSFGTYATGAMALGASSPSNAWLFYGGPSTHTKALRWNGRRWQLQTIPKWVVRFSRSGNYWGMPVVLSPRSVWVFSGSDTASGKPDHFASRYNGHRWVKVPMPGLVEQVRAFSSRDIWALGTALTAAGQPSSRQILMHWNGRRWHTVAIPAAHPPAGASEYVAGLTMQQPGEVWLQREIMQGLAGAKTMYLLHWNGKRWRKVKLGFPTSSVDSMTPDGRGGLWMTANGPAPGYQWRIYHLGSGRWTRYSAPTPAGTKMLGLSGVFWIPGTRSVWAAGQALIPHKTNGVVGMILKHGR